MRALLLAVAFSLVFPQQPSIAVPERARVDALTQQLGMVTGHLSIPVIGVDEVIREGVDLAVIDRGVSHWAGTSDPGGPGNMVLAGHRTVKTAPFHNLDLLAPGDPIYVTSFDGRTSEYRVKETFIVSPQEVWIADPGEDPGLTLFACHPKGSRRQRIVVRADLVDSPVLEFP